MTSTVAALLGGAGLALALLAWTAAVVLVRGARRRADAQVAALTEAHLELAARITALEGAGAGARGPVPARGATGPVRTVTGTHEVVRFDDDGEIVDAVVVGEDDAAADVVVDRRIDGRLFADLVVRESLVKGVSFAHGLKHALSGQTRNKIRYEMKTEVKRSRRARKDEVKVAVREYRARERARMAQHEATGENGE